MPHNFARKSFKELITERMQNRAAPSGLVVQNAAGPVATMRIYDEIGVFGITAESVASALEDVTADELEVQINSLGGDVFDGVAIYNALRAHPAKVTTRVDSMAASIASVIAQAGDHRVMLDGSQMMIHEAWGLVIGNASEMRVTADLLDKQSRNIAAVYAKRSGGDESAFMDAMVAESWFDAEESVANGLADEVVEPERRPNDKSRLAARIDALAVAAEEISERVADVAALRTDQGKQLDETWQTREDVDRLVASLDRLRATLSASDGPDPESTESPVDQERLERLRERVAAHAALIEKADEKLKGLQ